MNPAEWPHGGDLRSLSEISGIAVSDILDFSANINPLGPPDWMSQVVNDHLSATAHYPDPHCTELLESAAIRYQVGLDEILAGNGSSELLYAIPRLLRSRSAIIAVPCYADYRRAAELAGMQTRAFRLDPGNDFHLDFAQLADAIEDAGGAGLVLLGQPNNPTGRCFDAEELRALAARYEDCWFVIDEAFADFVEDLDRLTQRRPPNVIVLLSATKNWAIPGLRLGFAIADRGVVQMLRAALPPWSVNSLAQAVGCAALGDQAYGEHSRRLVAAWRVELAGWLSQTRGIHVFPGEANFLLARTSAPARLQARLLRRGIAIRDCSNFEGLDACYFRVAVRTSEENARLARALSDEHGGEPAIEDLHSRMRMK